MKMGNGPPRRKWGNDFSGDRRQAPKEHRRTPERQMKNKMAFPRKMENEEWSFPALRMSTTPTHRTHATELQTEKYLFAMFWNYNAPFFERVSNCSCIQDNLCTYIMLVKAVENSLILIEIQNGHGFLNQKIRNSIKILN